MKKAYTYALILLAILAISFGAILSRVFTKQETACIDLSKGAITTLSPGTQKKLESLTEQVKITYFTSEKKRMPTALRPLEAEIRALLRTMKRYGGSRFVYEVIHPEDKPQVARGLGRFRISSFQHKTIRRDEYSVRTVWSGMLIEYMGKSRAIPYITPKHLPHLENRLITHIQHIETDYTPVIAVNTPQSDFTGLRTLITEQGFGTVQEFSFGAGAGIPEKADFAFICQAEKLTPRDADSILKFLEDGKDVFFCFSNYIVQEDPSKKRFFVMPKETGLEEFLEGIGITLERSMVMEEKHLYQRPYHILAHRGQVNLEGFRLSACGTMLFPYSSPISINYSKLKEEGYSADTLAFSSAKAWLIPFARKGIGVLDKRYFSPLSEQNRKVENLAIQITSDKPWEGRIFLFSSGYIFSDSANYNGANRLYLKNIFMTFVQPEKVTSIRASKIDKPALPPISASARLRWRIFSLFAIPFIWFMLLFMKTLKTNLADIRIWKYDAKTASIFTAGAFAIFMFLYALKSLSFASFDATQARVNSLSPHTIDFVSKLDREVKIRYYTSAPSKVPISMRKLMAAVSNRLQTIAQKSRGKLSVSICEVPSDPDDQGTVMAEVRRFGITPFKMKMIEHDRYVEKLVFSGLVFEDEKSTEVIPHLDRHNVDRLEFVAVSAVKRLVEQKRPSVAFVADLPHLTASEFWELEQLNVKIMPKSEDVYSRFLALLRNEGYAVTVYSPKTKARITADVLIYIQPWVVSEHLKEQINIFLNAGKKVLIACQHYNFQARKYSGHAYKVAYWPQPQHSRINELLEPYGIRLVEEVFLDQSKAPMDFREQLQWGAYKKTHRRAPDAQPFIIRAVPVNFNKDISITSHLSDILFIWGNRWQKIPGAFPETLHLETLISSSEESWSIDWQGGFLSPDELARGDYFDVTQPLAVILKGDFPALDSKKTPSQYSGGSELMLIGSSELFKNEQLEVVRYDHIKFVLNAVAFLAYGEELSSIQARGGETAPGFPFVPPQQKLLWRFLVLFFAPLIFAIYGLLRRKKIHAASTLV